MARKQRLELEFTTDEDLDDVLTLEEIRAAITRSDNVEIVNYIDLGQVKDNYVPGPKKPGR